MSGGTGRRAEIGRGFVKGMLVAVVLTALNVALEHTAFGKRLGWYAYEELDGWLAASEPAIVIVDITDAPLTRRADGLQVTSREALFELARELARAGASAIGVDVDLSPEIGKALHPDDTLFFERLAALREGQADAPAVPVLVGVHRTLAEPSGAWLGDPRFAPMAAHLLVEESRIPAVPTWLVAAGAGEPLWGLGPALVRARAGALPPEPESWRWLRRANVQGHAQSALSASSMLVDTSPLETLVRERIRIWPDGPQEAGEQLASRIRAAVAGARVSGKIALIGAADPRDKRDNAFFVPGEERAYPGVYLHACAAHTVEQGYLYLVTPLGRIAADLALALFVFGGIALVRLVHDWRRRGPPREMLVFLILLAVSTSLALAGGLLGVARFRMIWDGFVYVGLAAVLHLFLEAWIHASRSSHPSAGGSAHGRPRPRAREEEPVTQLPTPP